MQDRLLFIIGSPRSGSTLLNRMLGAHTRIHAPVEPHLLTPLAHLGYYEKVDQAPYDPTISQRGIRELVRHLPRGEEDYLDALRACTDTLYARLLQGTGADWLLDKTPAYALVLDFAARLYPNARYVVLTRNPMAVWSSYVESFFDGDHVVAHAHNPLLERYVPAISRFLREKPAPIHHVQYEDLVADPEKVVPEICAFIGIDFEPGMIDYGETNAQGEAKRGLGDPMNVARHKRPSTESLAKWATQLQGEPGKVEQCREILARLTDEDLQLWGFTRKRIAADLDGIDVDARPLGRAKATRYALERRALVMLRRNIHDNALGRVVRQVRSVCDVLLR